MTDTLPWQDTIFNHHTRQTVWIEVPRAYRWQVYGQIADLHLPGLISTDIPRPSMGNRPDDAWSNIKLHFDDKIGGALMQEVIVGWLKKTFQPYQAIVGLQSTMSLDAAKMLEITSPSACFLLSHLHKSCLIISPRLAVVDTFTNYQTWGKP